MSETDSNSRRIDLATLPFQRGFQLLPVRARRVCARARAGCRRGAACVRGLRRRDGADRRHLRRGHRRADGAGPQIWRHRRGPGGKRAHLRIDPGIHREVRGASRRHDMCRPARREHRHAGGAGCGTRGEPLQDDLSRFGGERSGHPRRDGGLPRGDPAAGLQPGDRRNRGFQLPLRPTLRPRHPPQEGPGPELPRRPRPPRPHRRRGRVDAGRHRPGNRPRPRRAHRADRRAGRLGDRRRAGRPPDPPPAQPLRQPAAREHRACGYSEGGCGGADDEGRRTKERTSARLPSLVVRLSSATRSSPTSPTTSPRLSSANCWSRRRRRSGWC